MNITGLRARWSGVAAGLLAALPGFLGAPAAGLGAQDSGAGQAAAASTHSLLLDYREADSTPASSSLEFSAQTTPFAKEPGLGKHKLVRGTFKFGNSTEQFLPFIWDQTKGKLHLDLNRNGDLTDDAEGVFENNTKSYSSGGRFIFQSFSKVPLSFKTAAGRHRALVDLNLQSYNERPHATVHSRSYWDTKVTLDGKEWQLGYVESLTGKLEANTEAYLLLRPWEAHAQPFMAADGSLTAFHFSRHLFFGGRGYDLACTLVPAGDTTQYKLLLQEQPVELGELKLDGQFIQRMLLTATKAKTPYRVVLDTPGPRVKVPVGSYSAPQVYLRQGAGAAHTERRYGALDRSIAVVVAAARPARLAAGGPLTNTVSVSRRGRELSPNYQLVGARGVRYELAGARKQPEFAVYKGDKQLASGKFEFG